MKQRIDRRYLALPVSAHAKVKKIRFEDCSGRLVYDLDVKLDPVGAEHIYYIDMQRFSGQELMISVEPSIDFEPQFTDSRPRTGEGSFRPSVHFTPEQGWINDPNGLVFYGGKYHLFFQHNPAGMDWGNMHWGHAVSGDLIHWEEKDIALFPDETGTMFSGSAIVDKKNVSGLQRGEYPPILLFYTAAGNNSDLSRGASFTQCLAYSTDGGETFEKYHNNPVVPHIAGSNRDPKVIFSTEIHAWIMALYLEEDRYALMRSENLLNWTLMQELRLPGDNECPDFYPLELNGERYWILSGAHDCYLVGTIENGLFVPVQETMQLGRAGRTAYAAQTYSNMPDGRRIRISWNTFHLPGMPFNGSMTTPVEMFLGKEEGRIVLCCRPVKEFGILRGEKHEGAGRLELPAAAKACDICLRIAANQGIVPLNLYGLTITVDTGEGIVCAADYSMHAAIHKGSIELRLIHDVHATEIYSADGAEWLCIGHLADRSLHAIESTGNMQITAYPLNGYRNA